MRAYSKAEIINLKGLKMVKHGIRDISKLGETWTVWASFKSDTSIETIEDFLYDTYNTDFKRTWNGSGGFYSDKGILTRKGSRVLFTQDCGIDV
tara:strand:+ start:224 stop:505 length:282 start_codon:yes stop_codon:yes gene_type:complete